MHLSSSGASERSNQTGIIDMNCHRQGQSTLRPRHVGKRVKENLESARQPLGAEIRIEMDIEMQQLPGNWVEAMEENGHNQGDNGS